MEEYVNQIVHPIATDTEYRLGIHEWQHRFNPNTPMHENFVVLANLALPPPMEDRSELERALNFLLPTPNGETPPELPVANQVSSGEGMYMFNMAHFIFIH